MLLNRGLAKNKSIRETTPKINCSQNPALPKIIKFDDICLTLGDKGEKEARSESLVISVLSSENPMLQISD